MFRGWYKTELLLRLFRSSLHAACEWQSLLDVDEVKALEQAKRQQELRFNALLDLSGQVVMAAIATLICLYPLACMITSVDTVIDYKLVVTVMSAFSTVFIGYGAFALYGIFLRYADVLLLSQGLKQLKDRDIQDRLEALKMNPRNRNLRIVDYWVQACNYQPEPTY